MVTDSIWLHMELDNRIFWKGITSYFKINMTETDIVRMYTKMRPKGIFIKAIKQAIKGMKIEIVGYGILLFAVTRMCVSYSMDDSI